MAQEMREDNLIYAAATIAFIIVTSLLLGYLARLVARLRGLSPTEQRKVFWGFTFAGPWIVGFVIFVLGPALASLYYSFTDYKIGGGLDWVGLENYRTLLLAEGRQGRQFNKAMLNSFYYALIGVPLQIMAALAMALLLNNEVPGIRTFRMIFYMPVILAGGPAILLAWRYMLASNGGFINESMNKLGEFSIIFDYPYRSFIYIMEGFNGFYTGLTLGDPLGPLKYTFPAVIIALVLVLLARGEWSEGKRMFAWRAAQIIGIVTLYYLMSKSLMQQPIDPSWVYFSGVVTMTLILTLAWYGRRERLPAQVAALAIIVFVALVTWIRADFVFADADHYIIPLVLIGVPVAASLIGSWSQRKYQLLASAAAVLGLIILVRLAPGQLDEGRLNIIPRFLTFRSTLETTSDLDYLTDVYPYDTVSSLWFYGGGAALLVLIALLNNHYPRVRQGLLWIGLAIFGLIAAGSFIDGRTYFNAFEQIAEATGRPTYHFTLFREAIGQFPDTNRVPLWMNSELWSKPSLILITMWSSGAGMLIFLAALKGVPRTLYEAAEVDGANTLGRFVNITLPMISPAMFYNIVIGVIAALQTFESVYILQTPLTRDSLQSAAFLLYARTFSELHIGEGAAMSWILVVIILTLTILQFRFSRSWVHYEA